MNSNAIASLHSASVNALASFVSCYRAQRAIGQTHDHALTLANAYLTQE